jgi:transposase
MRGSDGCSGVLFSYVDLETRVAADHPLRTIRAVVNEALAELSPTFAGLYAHLGRPSIPPERLLRALLLQAFYSVRSERLLMEPGRPGPGCAASNGCAGRSLWQRPPTT